MVEVFAIKILNEESFLIKKDILLELLPLANRNFYSRFKRTSALQRSLFAELLSRFIISQKSELVPHNILFSRAKNGKPFLENSDTKFNLSHSGDWVVMALAEAEVGIDVELIRPVNYQIAERFFSKDEVTILNSKEGDEKLEYFFDLWTLKESYLKLIGTGLTRSLSSFTVHQHSGKFVISEDGNEINTNVFFKQYGLTEEYKLSVCSFNKNFNPGLNLVSVDDLLTC
jgi:4'-phosphopantetheinyl transferase